MRNNWRGMTDHLPTALQTPHVSDTGYTPLLTDMWAWNTCLSEKEETVSAQKLVQLVIDYSCDNLAVNISTKTDSYFGKQGTSIPKMF